MASVALYAVGSEVVDLAVVAFRLSAGSRLAWSLSAQMLTSPDCQLGGWCSEVEAVGSEVVGSEYVSVDSNNHQLNM